MVFVVVIVVITVVFVSVVAVVWWMNHQWKGTTGRFWVQIVRIDTSIRNFEP